MREPRLIRLRVDQIIPNPENARLHDDEQIRMLQKSMEKFGLVSLPVVQTGTHKLIAGHGRIEGYKAAGQGLLEIPVLEVDLDDQEAIAYGIADNRLSDRSDWSSLHLKAALVDLDDGSFDLECIGFSTDDMQILFPTEEEAPPPPPEHDAEICPTCGQKLKAGASLSANGAPALSPDLTPKKGRK
jgi:hypothetical protein